MLSASFFIVASSYSFPGWDTNPFSSAIPVASTAFVFANEVTGAAASASASAAGITRPVKFLFILLLL